MATTRRVYHVVHQERTQRWGIEREGSERATATAETKDEAVRIASRMAEEADPGQVIVHRADGSIEEEFTYGEDPRETPG
jgi:hypothetical protein